MRLVIRQSALQPVSMSPALSALDGGDEDEIVTLLEHARYAD